MIQNSNEIFVEETERKPNLYAANVLAGVVGVIAIVCIFNEIGIFTLNKLLVRTCFCISSAIFFSMQFIVHKSALIINTHLKYIIMSMVLLLVLTTTVLLNIHTILAFVLPMLLSTQYRSHKISCMALAGSCCCCWLAPVLSYFLRTWDKDFMIGLTQTFCGITVTVTEGNQITTSSAMWQIFLYWALPQILTIGAFGILLYSATKSGIDSVTNQMQIVGLNNDINKQLQSVLLMQERVLYSMSDIIESRDLETGGHVRRTSQIIRLIINSMKKDPQCLVSEEFCNNVIKSAPMHDLGKIAIPDVILRKTEKLTEEEFEEIKKHPIRSAEIIDRALTGIEDEEMLKIAKNIAKYHHEKVDGTGYPEGLKGNAIPLEARIMAIADVYDALVSKRCYKESMSHKEAFEIIENGMGTQFDPGLNRYFIDCKDEIEAFYNT